MGQGLDLEWLPCLSQGKLLGGGRGWVRVGFFFKELLFVFNFFYIPHDCKFVNI